MPLPLIYMIYDRLVFLIGASSVVNVLQLPKVRLLVPVLHRNAATAT
jgi:hypothetical protein